MSHISKEQLAHLAKLARIELTPEDEEKLLPQLEDIIGRWLIRKTQFNYGRAGLSEFGQDFGRIASMFMKWTQVIGSDVATMAQYNKGMQKLTEPARKYLTPLVLFGMLGAGLRELEVSDNPRTKLLIGRSLINHAPASAMFLTGPPPVLNTAFKLSGAAKEALQGELDKAGNLVTKALAPFVPGLGALPRITQTTRHALGMED